MSGVVKMDFARDNHFGFSLAGLVELSDLLKLVNLQYVLLRSSILWRGPSLLDETISRLNSVGLSRNLIARL